MLVVISLLYAAILAAAPLHTISGKVCDAEDGTPLAGVVVSLDDLWTVTDQDGSFVLKGVQAGKYNLKAVLLGYVDYEREMNLDSDMSGLEVPMYEQSLALEGVVVTASRTKDGIGTSHMIGRDALNHLQLSNMSDMSSLLPGGKTVNPDLTTQNEFSIRSGGSSAGNAAFSTAVEVDGVRIGNNAGFGEMSGVDTRNLSVDNVESVEVISGVPSAEYGDLGSGMVKVHTKTGRTPFNATFSVNPRTFQASVAKGIDLSEKGGVLNVSAEWTRATKKLTSPYESYTRRALSLKYTNTFSKVLRFEAGVTGNLGGMNSKDDPDAFIGQFQNVKDNVLRGNVGLTWLLNRSWITNLKFDASVNFNDNYSLFHEYHSSASMQPSVHSEEEGYFIADRLPNTYFSDQVVDSKELDVAASLKYTWSKRWGDGSKGNLKAGVQWKADGNAGRGEYYEDPQLAANGYRPRPYYDYPFMHNLSVYAEEDFTFPFGLEVTAGLRMDNVFVKNTRYRDVSSLSPRLNAKWEIGKHVTVRGGWGISEKLPSFYMLYPKQEYRDIQTFGATYGSKSTYVYYSQPYTMLYNEDLKWQKSNNAEIGVDLSFGEFSMSAVGFYNVTVDPYIFRTGYEPFAYKVSRLPSGVTLSPDADIRADSQTGTVFYRNSPDEVWAPMDTRVNDITFVKTTRPDNGAPVYRAGAELTMDFPEIKPVRTQFRLDASYTVTESDDHSDNYYYNALQSHTSLKDRSYQYVGIYPNGGGSNLMISGRKSSNLDANITAITRIPEARLVITCRLEMSLITRFINLPAAGKDVLYPLAFMTTDGQVHAFTEEMKTDTEYEKLVYRPNNDYLFNQDGYGPYCSANLSVTKEIGDHVSLSFFANNFTNSRTTVYSMATGVGAIFTPSFYYGLTCRVKL